MTTDKIIALINTIDPIFLDKKNRQKLYIAVQKNTPQSDLTRANFLADQIIEYKIVKKVSTPILDTFDIITKTDLTRIMHQKKIKYFLLPHRPSSDLKKWAKKNKFFLIAPPADLQTKFENKLFFDALLKKKEIPSPTSIRSQAELGVLANEKLVFQQAEGYGLFGTKFYSNAKQLLAKEKFNPKTTLIRQYLPGIPIGVSVALDGQGNRFYSAYRRQCYINENGFPKIFLGVQWLPKNFFSPKTNLAIEKCLNQLTDILISYKFVGMANFDIQISQGQPYVLECNPRLSSATQHVFSLKELTGYNDIWNFYLNSILKIKNSSHQIAKVPNSKFSGSLLDIDLDEKTLIKKVSPLGVYNFSQNKIKYLGLKIEKLWQNKNNFLLFHETPKANITDQNFTLATIISNFAVFDLKTGSLNEKGRILYKYFRKEALEK
ncbi:MAG: ATP-grasp domain-containing protein [Candidatus Buchananbacteria bacterium]